MVNYLDQETPSSFINILGFHFSVIDTDAAGSPTKYKPIQHVRGSQDIKVDLDTELIENWGDGEVQEMAVSTGKAKLDLQAFAIPLKQRALMLGYEVDDKGNVIRKKNLNPPYVGIVFAKEKANGDLEMVGLTRGMFQGGGHEGKTKEDKTEFGNASISGEFSSRFSDGVAEVIRLIKKDDTAGVNEFYQLVLGQTAPPTAIPWTAPAVQPVVVEDPTATVPVG